MWGHEGWLARGKVPVGATPRGTNAGAPSTGARPIAGIRNDSFGAQPGARPIAGSLGGFGGTPNRPPMQLPNIAPRPMAPWLQGAPGASLDPGRMTADVFQRGPSMDPGRMQANGAPGAMGSILQRILGGGGAGGRPPVPGGGLQTGLTNPSSAPSGFWSGIQTPNSRGLGTPMPAGMGGQPTNFADLLGLGRPLQNYRPNPNVDYSRVPMY